MSIEILSQVKVRANLDPDFRGRLLKSPLKFLQDYELTDDEKRQVKVRANLEPGFREQVLKSPF